MPTKALNIPQKQLQKLYLHKRLSTGAIANVYRCSHATILNYLKKYGISRRSRLGTRKPIRISKTVLFYLYHQRKLTQKQIAKKFGFSRYGIQTKMKKYHIIFRSLSEALMKYQKIDFSNNLSEKAYLIGFRIILDPRNCTIPLD